MGIHCQGSTCSSSLSWFVLPPLCPLRLMPMPLSCTEDTAMVLVPMVILVMPVMLVMLMPTTVTTDITMLPTPTAMPTMVPMVMPPTLLPTSTPMPTPDTTVMLDISSVRDLLMLSPPLML